MEIESGESIVVVKKSHYDIEEDLKSILLFDSPLKASDIQKLWTSYLELTVEPVGWKALWKMSRDICQQFEVEFPVVAVVMVDRVNYDMLTANVTVTGLDENVSDSSIPDQIDDIPLIQLYPTVGQENTSLQVSHTADSLESLRLFYRHLWYPWDIEDDSCTWVQDHLENRLQLHFDIISRKIPRDMLSKINNLIETGNDIFRRVQEQSEIAENNESDLILAQLIVELNCIKENLNLLEMKQMRDKIDSPEKVDKKRKVFLAWLEGVSDDLLNALQRIKSQLPEDTTSFSCLPSLEKILNECWVAKNMVYVGEGLHYLRRSCELSTEGLIEGVGAASKTLIEHSEGGCLLFDVLSRGSNFSNLTLVGSKVKFVVVVRFGRCQMTNVAVNGSHKNIAVLVESGAEFCATNCQFTDCSVAVEAKDGSKVTLKDCLIKNNANGLVYQSSVVHIENCHFVENMQSAVVQLQVSGNESGSVELENLQGVTAKGVTFTGNKINVSKKINNESLSSDECGEI
ncbi:protein nessun dorma [Nilaparvata lugens]|uniref:protein nessun dorma n=1 Tax=Nilaparvata lugens TaxID=108931 RepID=UPI00193D1A46|nr:protein nessun dorma [Nilaparvata lugens]